MDVLVKPTRGHRANCSLCMQMLDTLFGPEEEEEEEEEEEGESLMMGRALLSVATQDVIQLQQLPLSVFPQFDDTGRICNDDECFLRSLLRRFSHSAPTVIGWQHSSHSGARRRRKRRRLYKRRSLVCAAHGVRVCVNTEPGAHIGVWTARKRGEESAASFFFFFSSFG